MRVTIKGQVTIPQDIREKMNIRPGAEVDFIEKGGNVLLIKKKSPRQDRSGFRRYRGSATVKMGTDEIMKLTRSDE
jgi:AbrB family looped-hinge helix DNA binding protein